MQIVNNSNRKDQEHNIREQTENANAPLELKRVDLAARA